MTKFFLFILSFPALFVSYCERKDAPPVPPPVPPPVQQRHYVSEAVIYDENLKTIKKFAGLGAFFDDGSFVLARHERDWLVTRFSPLGEVQWERKIYTHHQLNLSPDQKRVLVMSGENRKESGKTHNYDTFYVLDAATGKTLAFKSSYDFLKSGLPAFEHNSYAPDGTFLKSDGACFHFNSFYEIPPNAAEKENPAFERGNFVINDAFRPYLLIIDKTLKRILWTEKPFAEWAGFHDVQLLADGKFLFYRGGETITENRQTAVFKYDPITKKSEIIFPENLKDPSVKPFIGYSESKGSAQQLENGYLISHYDSVQGGMVMLTDKTGRLVKTMFNPDRDKISGKPAGIQQVKQYDLNSFLKNNRM